MTRRTVRLSPPTKPSDPRFADWLYQLYNRVIKVFPAGLLLGDGTQDVTAVTNSSTVGQILRVTGAATYGWGALDLADGDAVTGTLPIGNGGTNSATALSGSTIMLSNGTAIVQGTAGTSTTLLHGNASGAPTYSSIMYGDFGTDTVYTAWHGWNGASNTSATAVVTSDGATITLTVEKSGGGDLTLIFSTGPATFDCTPAKTVALTAGTNASPTLNYVYVLASDLTQLTKSTTGWPSAEHHPIGTFLCPTAARVQADGLTKVHLWTDHIWKNTTQNGHVAHLNAWIRTQPATWRSGVACTPTINAGTPDTIDVATTAGVVLQLRDHSYPAYNTATGSFVYVVNSNSGAFTKATKLPGELADGTAITAGKRIIFVIWGVVSEADGDCKLMVNLPTGYYASDALAQADDSHYANYNIPADFVGCGFLIARLIFSYAAAGGGDYTLVENVDLRGLFPSIAGGGTAAFDPEFADSAFVLYDEGDSTKRMNVQLSGITTGNTRTITVPDLSGNLLLAAQIAARVSLRV